MPRKKENKKERVRIKTNTKCLHNSRGQADLIDLQTQEYRGYKYIMTYQDHFTKFTVLRALKSKTAEEVANYFDGHIYTSWRSNYSAY